MGHTTGPSLRLLDPARGKQRILLVVAAPTEARAVVRGVTGATPPEMRIAWEPIELDDRVSLLVTGVGKANGAGGTARVLKPSRDGIVVSIGVGGALPEPDSSGELSFRLGIGEAVRCRRSVFVDEGVQSDEAWHSMADRGFGPRQGLTDESGMAIHADDRLLSLLADHVPATGDCATVSSCSGSDDGARRTAERGACAVEAMEGAAVGLAVLRIAPQIPFIELRVVSNRTGGDQRWNLPSALERLASLAAAL